MPQFKTFSEDQLNKVAAERLRRIAYARPEFEVFEPGPGDHAIRIIPPLQDDPWADAFFLTIRTHWLGRTILCPASIRQLNRNCPVCQEFFERRKQGDIPQEINGISGVIRHLMWVWVVPLQGQQPEMKPKVYPCPDSLLDSILRAARDRITKRFLNFLDPQQGGLIVFTKEGQGLSTKYVNVELDKNPTPIPDQVLQQIVTWQEALIVPSQQELEQMLEDYLSRLDVGSVSSEAPAQPEDVPLQSQAQVNMAQSNQVEAPPQQEQSSEPAQAPETPEDVQQRLQAIRQRLAQFRQQQ